jgi:hypothetical protein
MCERRASRGYGTSPQLSRGRLVSCKEGSVVLSWGGVVARLDAHILLHLAAADVSSFGENARVPSFHPNFGIPSLAVVSRAW